MRIMAFSPLLAVSMASDVRNKVLPHPQGPSRMSFGQEKIALCLGFGKAHSLMLARDPASWRALLTNDTMLPLTGRGIGVPENSEFCIMSFRSSMCLHTISLDSSSEILKKIIEKSKFYFCEVRHHVPLILEKSPKI